MAKSYITVEFIAIPNENDYLGIDEQSLGIGLNEIFKNIRSAAAQVKIPQTAKGRYEMVYDRYANISDIGVRYMPIDGIYQDTSLGSIITIDNLDGTFTAIVDSFVKPSIIYSSSGTQIIWEGDFNLTGESYSDFISDNYKEALDLDYNYNNQFTIESFPGEVGTGLGTVRIIANFPNAVFFAENRPFTTITINNTVEAPDNSISPSNMIFNVDAELPGAPGQTLNVISESDDWTITPTLPAWLSASTLSGSGSASLNIRAVNYTSLPSGVYNYTLIVTIGAAVFELPVTLNVSANISNPFEAGKLYFTESPDYLIFDLDIANSFIHLNIEVTAFDYQTSLPVVYSRIYDLPLFKGKADFHVGSIVNDLFDEIKEMDQIINSFDRNYIVNQYRPAEVRISFEEKIYGTSEVLSNGTFPMFKMAYGHKQFTTKNQLTLLTAAQQDMTRITANSPIATSFVFFGKPRIVVKKNNVVIDDFEAQEDPNNLIFSYFRFNNNLKVGDVVEIIVVNELETRTQRFLVMPRGVASTFFFFENKNRMLEPFEFTGRRRINSTLTAVKNTKVKGLYTFEKKAFSKNLQSMIVNTGQLTKTEHRIITALCDSDKVWCSFDDPAGPYFRVDAITTKIPNEDTSASEESLDVEFNILENANASIYPR